MSSNIQFSAPTNLFIEWYKLNTEQKKEVNNAMRQTLEKELKRRKLV